MYSQNKFIKYAIVMIILNLYVYFSILLGAGSIAILIICVVVVSICGGGAMSTVVFVLNKGLQMLQMLLLLLLLMMGQYRCCILGGQMKGSRIGIGFIKYGPYTIPSLSWK